MPSHSRSKLGLAAAIALAASSTALAASADPTYVMSEQGQSCATACGLLGRTCVPLGATSVPTDVFSQASGGKIVCNQTSKSGDWWAPDQPSYVSDKSDPNYGDCLGYNGIPDDQGSFCQAYESAVQRVCSCGDDISTKKTFGTGYSGGTLDTDEITLFAHKISPPAGFVGVMTHFWTTCSAEAEAGAIFRYYVDGEDEAGIEFTPSLAAGVGFDDPHAPWGTKWAGLGAGNGQGQAWFLNFKIPFGSSIRITAQHPTKKFGGFYFIARGMMTNTLDVFPGLQMPLSARLHLQRFSGPMKPLETLDVINVPKGNEGVHFMSTLAVSNDGTGGLNFLEGCYHMYDPVDASFPGTLLSTGTEDYFDSGWYFNAGQFEFPVSGFTHSVANKTRTEWSGYRYHEMDPLQFSDGFRFTWRCGDTINPSTGLKCFEADGTTAGHVVGQPTCGNVDSYAWYYSWKANQQ